MKAGLALAALGALALATRRETSSGDEIHASDGGRRVSTVVPPSAYPDRYAHGVLSKLRHRAERAELVAAVVRWRDVFFPGVPVSAMIAAGATSTGAHERGGPPDFATGLWGVEWPRVIAWARDEQTMRQLGRPIPTNAVAFSDDVDAQAYAGFRSYRAHLDAVTRQLGAELAPSGGSAWLWRLAIASYSSGPGVVAGVMRASRAELVSTHEAMRWRAAGLAIVRARRAGHTAIGGIPLAGKWRAAHTIIRNEQRHAAGLLLSQTIRQLAGDASWYSGPLDAELVDQLAAIANGA